MLSSNAIPTHYQILKVKPAASTESIRASYHRLAKKYHPDVNKSPLAAEYFKSLTEAFNVLKDPGKRKQYDAELVLGKFGGGSRPAPTPEMQKVYAKIAKAVQQKQTHPIAAIFDILDSFIEPGTHVSIPLPGNIKLKLSSKQLHTLVSSADVLVQGFTRRRK